LPRCQRADSRVQKDPVGKLVQLPSGRDARNQPAAGLFWHAGRTGLDAEDLGLEAEQAGGVEALLGSNN
jgi:hypothetical protein